MNEKEHHVMKNKIKHVLPILFALLIILASGQMAWAGNINFPLLSLDGSLVANEDTRYIVEFTQDSSTMLITASLIIKNGSSGSSAKPIVISGVGFEISFSNKVEPCEEDKNKTLTNRFRGDLNTSVAEIRKYCVPYIEGFDVIGSNALQNNSSRRFIGATITAENETQKLSIAPNTSTTIAIITFMPVNGTDSIDLDTFDFEYLYQNNAPGLRLTRLSTWLGNGTYFLIADERVANAVDTYVLNPRGSFELHIRRPKPNVSAGSNGNINNYDPATMEWSAEEGRGYTSTRPSNGFSGTVYVRYQTGASAGDDTYGKYKSYLPGEAAMVSFDGAPPVDARNYWIVTYNPNGGYPTPSPAHVPKSPVNGTVGSLPTAPTYNGYQFKGWSTSRTATTPNFTATSYVNDDITVYAIWESLITGLPPTYIPEPGNSPLGNVPPGFTADHIPFISGYPDNTMKPNNPITRAEAAMIFWRLLISPEKSAPRASTFSDVGENWFAQAVNYLASIKIIEGYPDGTFGPNRSITRAEFAAIASRFDNLTETSTNAFPDIEGHWAKAYINSAFARGWVSGYAEDNTFRPQRNITRAEVVKVVNNMMNRRVRINDIPYEIRNGIIQFSDTADHWAYDDIIEASNNHDFIRQADGYETWVRLK